MQVAQPSAPPRHHDTPASTTAPSTAAPRHHGATAPLRHHATPPHRRPRLSWHKPRRACHTRTSPGPSDASPHATPAPPGASLPTPTPIRLAAVDMRLQARSASTCAASRSCAARACCSPSWAPRSSRSLGRTTCLRGRLARSPLPAQGRRRSRAPSPARRRPPPPSTCSTRVRGGMTHRSSQGPCTRLMIAGAGVTQNLRALRPRWSSARCAHCATQRLDQQVRWAVNRCDRQAGAAKLARDPTQLWHSLVQPHSWHVYSVWLVIWHRTMWTGCSRPGTLS